MSSFMAEVLDPLMDPTILPFIILAPLSWHFLKMMSTQYYSYQVLHAHKLRL